MLSCKRFSGLVSLTEKVVKVRLVMANCGGLLFC